MPLGRFLKILLSGLFLLAVLFIATKMDHYDLESLKTSFLLIREGTIRFLSDFVDFVERKDKFIIALSTIFIAFFTIILGFATGLLWRATRSLVRGAENTAERQLRAYVLPEKCWFENFGSDRPRFRVITKNYGQTPASETKIWVGWRYHDQFPHELPTSPPDDLLMCSNFLGPLGFTTHFDDADLGADRREALRIGEAIFFVLGTITYKDVFGKVRMTKFRFACGRDYGMPDIGGTLYVCHEGNEAD